MTKPTKRKLRLLSTANVLDKKFKTFDTLKGVWRDVLGTPTRGGIWIIYGNEKNGKTWFALSLFLTLAKIVKCLYVSAEEGISQHFQNTLQRIGLPSDLKKLLYYEYLEIELIEEVLKQRNAPKVVFLDNATVYADELKNGKLRELQRQYPNVLFIIIAHEDSGEPYTATAKLAKRLADVIIRVTGLTAFVFGRCPGGEIYVDEEKAQLYHGVKIEEA
ncbi:AAA ATPase [Pseudopedobacter saltans DSM 12145]|uniref:AAA ATPase n=1 Tax=Pseudopedobacter saltans (strain ATCC 51119 / DSM 12145 / JCM 21818 / CCUG 39354 / LMG 10337 / NBRC 100064 / NCIMB 13643) TaxID=762903 RepID=F0SAV1_PSESL|nr:ATPase AAA [Pseudopedobacter saltans]ADY51546.1 AAA ATPase [Pseudopedobacter saltans DSM 12145]